MRRLSAVLAIAALVASSSATRARTRPFPTPQKENETVEESISRIKYDEARGRKMMKDNDTRLRKLVGEKIYADYQKGECPDFGCVKAKSKEAMAIVRRNNNVSRTMDELVQEKQTLTSMVTEMDKPLSANTLARPGVTRAVPPTTGTPAPLIPATNPLMPTPVPAPGTVPAAPAPAPAAPAAPGSAQPPTGPGV